MRTGALAFLDIINAHEVVLADAGQKFRSVSPAGIHGENPAGAVKNGNLRIQCIERGLQKLLRCLLGKFRGSALGDVLTKNAQAARGWISMKVDPATVG